jgi:hypothetical protein
MNLSETVPNLIAQGADKIIKNTGDNLYSLAGANNSADSNYFMSSLLVSSNDQFINNPWIQDMKGFNSFWYGVFFLLFVLIGAVLVWRSNNGSINPNNPFIKSGAFDSETYLKTIITGLIIFMFSFYGLNYILKLEWLITQGLSLQTFNILPPASSNPIAYFFGAGIYLALSGFFMIRYFIVGLTCSFLLFLLGLYLFPFTRGAINEILAYAALMLFSRFVIAGSIAGGMALIQSLPLNLANSPFPYLILGVLVILISLIILFGPVTIIRAAKIGMKAL